MKQPKRNILVTATALILLSVVLKFVDHQQRIRGSDVAQRVVSERSSVRVLAQEELPFIQDSSRPESKLVTDFVCHLIIVDSFLPLGEQSTQEQLLIDEIGCVPMNGNFETHDLLVVNGLNSSWIQTNKEILFSDQLFVSFTNVWVDRGSMDVINTSTVSLVTMKSSNIKDVHERGTLDIAVVLVSTLDSSPSFSPDDIKDTLFNETKVNLMTQYDACSFGKLKFQLAPAGVISVMVNEPTSTFDSGLALVTAAQVELQRNSQYSMAELGDKVIVCLPPNVGSRPWVASAGVGHWRAQFNDDWCLSLSATMHEIGHTLGLTHSNQDGEKYGDTTGYMAAGYRSQTQPRRCFNGIQSWDLGWYKTRHYWIDPFVTGDQIIKLAPLVDFDKTSADEAVIINIRDKYYVSFNRAKGMNIGSGEKRNQVTLTTAGDGGSESLVGLDIGDVYEVKDFMRTGQTLLVAVCEFQRGRRHAPDLVFVSVGIGSASLCRINTIFHRLNSFLR